MFCRPFLARVKVNQRRLYSCSLAQMGAVAVATGWLKKGLKNSFCKFKKNLVVTFFSSFAHYELTVNPFCQHFDIHIDIDIGDFRNSS